MKLIADHLTTLPIIQKGVILEAHCDALGHMNVARYMHFFSQGAWEIMRLIGIDVNQSDTHHLGGFALEQHLRYLNEVLAGARITVRGRMLARSAKRMHLMQFLVVEADKGPGKLAATFEAIAVNVDLHTRRSSPWPPDIATNIDHLIAKHQQLDWEAPVCGVMQP